MSKELAALWEKERPSQSRKPRATLEQIDAAIARARAAEDEKRGQRVE